MTSMESGSNGGHQLGGINLGMLLPILARPTVNEYTSCEWEGERDLR